MVAPARINRVERFSGRIKQLETFKENRCVYNINRTRIYGLVNFFSIF